jgi:P pilus assembly chaperone PapD
MKRLWLAAILFLIASVNAYAVSVQPSVVKIQVAAGETKNGTFDIYNRSDKEVYIKVNLKDWIIDKRTSKREFLKSGTNPKTLNDWVIIEPEGFLLGADKHQTVRYTVKVPKDAKGGYWGLACFTTKPLEKKGGVVAAGEVVSFLGLEVVNTIEKKIEIRSIKAYNDAQGMKLKVEVKNIGNTPIFMPAPEGKYEIKNGKNETVTKGELNGQMILPEEIIDYETTDPVKLDKGEYTAVVFFDYGAAKMIGKKATLSTATTYDWTILEEIKAAKKATPPPVQ